MQVEGGAGAECLFFLEVSGLGRDALQKPWNSVSRPDPALARDQVHQLLELCLLMVHLPAQSGACSPQTVEIHAS